MAAVVSIPFSSAPGRKTTAIAVAVLGLIALIRFAGLESRGAPMRDLPHPLRIGIGIHFGEAIVGAMGPPAAQIKK